MIFNSISTKDKAQLSIIYEWESVWLIVSSTIYKNDSEKSIEVLVCRIAS